MADTIRNLGFDMALIVAIKGTDKQIKHVLTHMKIMRIPFDVRNDLLAAECDCYCHTKGFAGDISQHHCCGK